jgi:hypothetical protein
MMNTLIEAQNYEDMFSKFLSIINQYGTDDMKKVYNQSVKNDIANVKREFKKADRITWYLRYVKVDLLNSALRINVIPEDAKNIIKKDLENTIKKGNIPTTPVSSGRIMSQLQHFLSLTQVTKIQNYTFKNQPWEQVKKDFEDFEQEWQDSLETNAVKIQDDDKMILEFDGGKKAWWLLGRGACRDEANQMGHCGNVPSEKYGDRILSFRTATENPELWVPHLTFIRNRQNMLGEMKGKSNQKPNKKYHPYIVQLLRSKYVDGILGGGYQPENNFSMNDLPDTIRAKLIEEKPELASLYDLYKKEGFTTRVKNMVYDRVDSHGLPEIYDIDENNTILHHFGDFKDFITTYEYESSLFQKILQVFYEGDDEQQNEISENLIIDDNIYEEILDKLSDDALAKLKNEVAPLLRGFDTPNNELAPLIDNSKYAEIIRKLILDTLFVDPDNIEDFDKFKYMIIRLVAYSTRGAINEYISDVDMENIQWLVSTDNFLDALSSDRDDNHESGYFLNQYNGMSDYIPELDSYELTSNLKDRDFLNDQDSDEELFDKYIGYLNNSNTRDKNIQFTPNLTDNDYTDIANKLERSMVMTDSTDISRLKVLAGI